MKIRQIIAALIAALLIMPNACTVLTVFAEGAVQSVSTERTQNDSLQPDTYATSSTSDEPPSLPPDFEELPATPPTPEELPPAQPDFEEFPATSSTPAEELTITAELVEEGEQAGLYVTLQNLPRDVSMIRVQESFGGLDYNDQSQKMWLDEECIPDENGSLTLFCYETDEYPLAAFLSESVNSLYIKVLYKTSSSFDSMESDPVRFSHNRTYEIPGMPPPFKTELKEDYFGYTLIGHFKDFLPNVARVCNTYSWDGIDYQYTNPDWPIKWELTRLGNPDPEALGRLEKQEVGQDYEEPLVSFIARERDSFYFRLEITTEEGEIYYSQPSYISRGGPQPLPENLTPRVLLGFDLSVTLTVGDSDSEEDEKNHIKNYTHGEYQLTVPENITREELMALLPDTVPVRVRLWDKYTEKKYTFGDLDCDVTWKELPSFSLTPGQPYVIEDAAEPLLIPAGTYVEAALGTYILQKPLAFKSRYDSDNIHLVLNPVGTEAEPDIALRGYNLDLIEENGDDGNESRRDDPMSLAFWNKPSGAVSMRAYSVARDVRTEIGDLVELRDINHNQSHALYGYIDLLQPDEYPFREYLAGELDSFSIELEIEGGVYDGKKVMLPWPMEYEGPEEIFDPYGFDGQENNAGSGYEEIEEDDGNNGGQPPWYPPADKPESSGRPGRGDRTPPGAPEVLPLPDMSEELPAAMIPESIALMDNALPSADGTKPGGTKPGDAKSGGGKAPSPDSVPAESQSVAVGETSSSVAVKGDDTAAMAQSTLPKEQSLSPEDSAPFRSENLPLALKAVLTVAGVGTVVTVSGAAGIGQSTMGRKLLGLLKKLLPK